MTWVNKTNADQILRFDDAPTTQGDRALFLPFISRNAGVQAADARLHAMLNCIAAIDTSLSVSLKPGATYTQRFNQPGVYEFRLASGAEATGRVQLSGTALLSTSPANGTVDVAVTRETILAFSGTYG